MPVTMDENNIRATVMKIADGIVGNMLPDGEELSDNEKINIILSESLQALIFVTSIEDEFNIQLEDDEIDIVLFQGIDITVEKITQQLLVKLHE
jgi:acyl carrier protein